MKNRDKELELEVLKTFKENPNLTQRQVAKELNLSLGKTHYLIKGLIEKGWVKLENFKKSDNKKRYSYLLTWSGMAQKTKLTWDFLKRKEKEYEELKAEIDNLKLEVDKEEEML